MNLWLWTKKRKKKPTKSVCIPSLKKKKQQIIPKVNAFIHICTRRQLCTYMTVLYAISLTFSISLFSLARQRVRKGEKVDKRKTWLARKYNHQQKKNCVLLLCHQMQMVRIWWNLCVSRYSTVQCSLLFHNRSILFRIVEAVYTTTLLPYLFSLLRFLLLLYLSWRSTKQREDVPYISCLCYCMLFFCRSLCKRPSKGLKA